MLTTTKHNIIVIAAAASIAAAIPFILNRKSEQAISYKVFHSGTGWGYDIAMNGKLIIHQECIPAINEKKQFLSEAQARETAQLVISKLKNNKFPTLSKTEVEQICAINH